jgi:hypothetical protein
VSPVAMAAGGGWISVAWSQPERRLSLRIEEREDGRLQIVELMLADPEGLSGALLRDLQLGAWEAQMNSPEIAAALRAQFDERGPGDFYDLVHAHETLASEVQAAPMSVDDGALEFRFPAGISYAVAIPVEPVLKMGGHSSGKRPDEFYRAVAQAYSWLAGRERRPAKELAAINDVPASTVHRWVKEARRRGLLGPGRRLVVGGTPGSAEAAGQGAQIIYDPTSATVLEWAKRVRAGQVSESDLANDPLMRAWAARIRTGAAPELEQAFDPIVSACFKRLQDSSIPGSERYNDPVARLVLDSIRSLPRDGSGETGTEQGGEP